MPTLALIEDLLLLDPPPADRTVRPLLLRPLVPVPAVRVQVMHTVQPSVVGLTGSVRAVTPALTVRPAAVGAAAASRPATVGTGVTVGVAVVGLDVD